MFDELDDDENDIVQTELLGELIVDDDDEVDVQHGGLQVRVHDDADDVIDAHEKMRLILEVDEDEVDVLVAALVVWPDEMVQMVHSSLDIHALVDTILLEDANTYATDTASIALLQMELYV